MDTIKVLFVCLGNICRSPMAEAIFHHQVAEKGLADRFEADSAGTEHYHIGKPADPRTIQTIERMGIKISHSARQLQGQDLAYYDYILAMDADNKRNILALARADVQLGGHIYLMRDFEQADQYPPLSLANKQELSGTTGLSVPDPYYGGDAEFQEVYHMLERSINHFIDYVSRKHRLTPHVR